MKPLPYAPETYDPRNEQETRTTLERAIGDIERALPRYDVPALEEPRRTLTDTSDLTEIRETLITLLNDLQNRRVT